ncbi:hypothetical protein [Shewanella sp. Isolate7]|uniref:hypothetical protein n=1 Tax=Shewanella sp. Isolate7 TaxID=2908528 RepID=UPI001EFDB15C|nr:hypothetical protein [Shewanella sp. Isolate7]MCG9720642.1 hypothetical protein [Shewanella sp. Isolate7]
MLDLSFDGPWTNIESPLTLEFDRQPFNGVTLTFDEPWPNAQSPIILLFDGTPVEPPSEPTKQVLGINVGVSWAVERFIQQQLAMNEHAAVVDHRAEMAWRGDTEQARTAVGWQAQPVVTQAIAQGWRVKIAATRRLSIRWTLPKSHQSSVYERWDLGEPKQHSADVAWHAEKATQIATAHPWIDGEKAAQHHVATWHGESTGQAVAIRYGFPEPRWICSNRWEDVGLTKSPLVLRFDDAYVNNQSPLVLRFDEVPEVCHWDNGGGFIPGNPVLPSLDLKIPIEPQIRRSYIMQPQISCIRVSDGLSIVIKSVSISKSRSQWASSGNLAFSSRIDAERAANELLKISINGYDFYLLCEATSESRGFGQSRYSASCRGRFAELSAPYKKPVNYVNTTARSFMGMMGDIVENMGWTLASAITDYNVPANAFSYAAKTPAEAVNMMANAIGAMLDIDDETKTITVIPQWPTVPWDVANAVPDVILHDGVILDFTKKRVIRTNANAVFVRGEQQGVAVKVKRTGTAGDEFAADVVDKLITDNQAGRMRGTVELAEAGNKVQNIIRTKVMADLPPMRPGMLIGVTAGASVFKSVCDAVTISASVNESTGAVTVNQNVTLLRNEVAA